MAATAEVVGHPYGPEGGCRGGLYCEHTDSISVLFTKAMPKDGDFLAFYHAALDELAAKDRRIGDGHAFRISVW